MRAAPGQRRGRQRDVDVHVPASSRQHERAAREGRDADPPSTTCVVPESVYTAAPLPLSDTNAATGLLREVDGTGDMDEVFARLEGALEPNGAPA